MCIAGTKKRVSKLFAELKEEYKLYHYGLKFTTTTTQVGQCNWGKKLIKMSLRFMETCPWEETEDTLRHEFAHALDAKERGFSAHDANWRKWCKVTGAKPNSHKDLSDDQRPQKKYVILCDDCGEVNQVSRNTGKYNKKEYICGTCNKKGKIRFLSLALNFNYSR